VHRHSTDEDIKIHRNIVDAGLLSFVCVAVTCGGALRVQSGSLNTITAAETG
jgi:hypothetical protein